MLNLNRILQPKLNLTKSLFMLGLCLSLSACGGSGGGSSGSSTLNYGELNEEMKIVSQYSAAVGQVEVALSELSGVNAQPATAASRNPSATADTSVSVLRTTINSKMSTCAKTVTYNSNYGGYLMTMPTSCAISGTILVNQVGAEDQNNPYLAQGRLNMYTNLKINDIALVNLLGVTAIYELGTMDSEYTLSPDYTSMDMSSQLSSTATYTTVLHGALTVEHVGEMIMKFNLTGGNSTMVWNGDIYVNDLSHDIAATMTVNAAGAVTSEKYYVDGTLVRPEDFKSIWK